MGMIVGALRDMSWRRRRFAVVALGTALVFTMTLLLSGLSSAFDHEITVTLGALRADNWVSSSDATGPFIGAVLMSDGEASTIKALPGVTSASPVVFGYATVGPAHHHLVSLLGVQVGGVGAPTPTRGRGLQDRPDAVVGSGLGVPIGETFKVGGQQFTVVGTIDDASLFGGLPTVFVTFEAGQDAVFYGQKAATVVAIRGSPTDVPPKYRVWNDAATRADLLLPVDSARSAIDLITLLLWIVAAAIIGSVVYLSALERLRDFAVFKATGASTASIGVGLALQAVIVALSASLLAVVLAELLAPRFPLPVTIHTSTVLLLPVLAVAMGLVASVFGLRRSVKVDPALAFGGP